MEQLILRQAAIDALRTCYDTETITMDNGDEYINYGDAVGKIEQLPPIQPEPPTAVQDILQYLDEYLHPIVSPEHWSVYSELHDMVSMLPSAQPETTRRIVGKSKGGMTLWYECERCGEPVDEGDKFCRGCGAKKEVTE